MCLYPRLGRIVLCGASVCATIAWCAAAPPRSSAAPQYYLTILGTLGGKYSYGLAINDEGQVTGRAYVWVNNPDLIDPGNTVYNAFLYDGVMHQVNPYFSYGTAINASGHVVGFENSNGYHAFLYDGTRHYLPTLGGTSSVAYGVNDHDQVVGSSDYKPTPTSTPYRHAFFYDGTMHDLGTLGGLTSYARAVNNRGQVAGYSSYDVASTNGHAFMYDGSLHDLGTLGGPTSTAMAINDDGLITGGAELANNNVHAYLYDGAMHDLGTVSGTYSYGYGINDRGQVVGDSSGTAGNVAFLYDDGAMFDLNSLVINQKNWNLYTATGINKRGQITGTATLGGKYRAYIATPIPEIPGDENLDGYVTGADYTVWADHYGTAVQNWTRGDFNGDGFVTGADYTIWADHLSTASAALPVPEPPGMVLASLGIVVLLTARKVLRAGHCRAASL